MQLPNAIQDIDFEQVKRIESRIQEIAVVSPTKAPELLATFNIAFLTCSRAVSRLEFEINTLQRAVDQRKSVLLLDELPAILKAKGVWTAKSPMGSEATREAVISADAPLMQLREKVDELTAWSRMFSDLKRGFEMAYGSVKKIVGDNPTSTKPNPYLAQPKPTKDWGSDDGFFGDPK